MFNALYLVLTQKVLTRIDEIFLTFHNNQLLEN